jgi:hypothetical protein
MERQSSVDDTNRVSGELADEPDDVFVRYFEGAVMRKLQVSPFLTDVTQEGWFRSHCVPY